MTTAAICPICGEPFFDVEDGPFCEHCEDKVTAAQTFRGDFGPQEAAEMRSSMRQSIWRRYSQLKAEHLKVLRLAGI